MKSKGKRAMKVESIRTLNGPNVYSHHPVLLMHLDLGELLERESREFKTFNEQLVNILPGIRNHHWMRSKRCEAQSGRWSREK